MSGLVQVAMLGAAGRMGRAIIRCLHSGAVPGLQLRSAVDVAGAPDFGRDAGLVAGVGELGVCIRDDLAAALDGADVAIDFSLAQGTAAHAAPLAAAGCAWVIGTTGLDAGQLDQVRATAQQVPVVMAPNMSLGVNLLFTLVEDAARALKDRGYDVEVVERHHRRKKDAPSGTALGLGEAAARGFAVSLPEVARHGREGVAAQERSAQEIGFHAIRAGDFVGDHTVIFAADGESVELSHRATNRDTFAIGALQASAWVCGKEPGLYHMRDVLGL